MAFHGISFRLFIRKIRLIVFLVRRDDEDAKSKEAFSAYFIRKDENVNVETSFQNFVPTIPTLKMRY